MIVARQISAVDATIYSVEEYATDEWEQNHSKWNVNFIAISSLIGLTLFFCGFLCGGCVIWKCYRRLRMTNVEAPTASRPVPCCRWVIASVASGPTRIRTTGL